MAGGNGTGNRRECGIDPSTGIQHRLFSPRHRFGSGQFSPVTWHQLIDGVFVPDGSAGAVEVDSAKHAFDGFPQTNKMVYGSIWARATKVIQPDFVQDVELWIYAIGNAEHFAPERRGVLALCPNAGITFNLETMRKNYPEVRPIRFRAVAGMADARPLYPGADGLAEIWIMIDGRLKFHRENIRPTNAPISVDVSLASGDQYLTIVATDGGNGCACDWIVFGDPVLEMGSNDQDASNLSLRENSKEGK
ncbi:MAG: hypothetical protein GX594_16030 [Pirellulaceae bacterium]|nr:hypothetical protein [Pirellulaceae bacterium]